MTLFRKSNFWFNVLRWILEKLEPLVWYKGGRETPRKIPSQESEGENPPHDSHLQSWRCQWFAPMGAFKGTWGSLEEARSEPLGGDNFWEPMPQPETGSSKTKCWHEPTVREQWADEGASERKEKAGDWGQRVRRTGWQKKILAWPRLSHGHIKDHIKDNVTSGMSTILRPLEFPLIVHKWILYWLL